MPNVQVSYEEMRSAAGRLKTGEEEITQRLGALQQMISQLVESAFKTESASPKFRESYEAWNKGAQQAIAGLKGMQTFLESAISRHQELDNQLSGNLPKS